MPASATRSQRVEARLLPTQKRRIERAAEMRGQSVSDFMVQHADRAAKDIIESERVWVLTEQDQRVFLAALKNPPKPNTRLKAAASRYKKVLESL